jgi:hypothetical protein
MNNTEMVMSAHWEKNEIIRIANEVGIKGPESARLGFKMYANPDRLKRFAEVIAATEREGCARLVEQSGVDGMGTLAAAAMIRKRGEK